MLIAGIYNVKQTKSFTRSVRYCRSASDRKIKKLERFSHSIYPATLQENDLKVLIGNDQCNQPYSACIFNIGLMKNTHPIKFSGQQIIEKKSNCSKNSYEERLHTYCLAGEDLVLQIRPNYACCRTVNGNLNSKVFKEKACRAEVKMIELILPTAIKSSQKVNSSLDIGDAFNTKTDIQIFPGSSYSTFKDAEGMIHLLDSLRELSGRKPIGVRLSISDKKEFREICYTIRKTQLIPDYIVVEGSFESTNTEGKGIPTRMPLYEALLFVSHTLQIYGLDKEIKILVSGEIKSCFDILKVLALGASVVCTEMPGYTIYDRNTFPFYKDQHVNDFHNSIMKATVQAMNVCGFRNVSEITILKLFRRLDVLYSKGFDTLNGSILYPDTIEKIYNSQINTRYNDQRRHVKRMNAR